MIPIGEIKSYLGIDGEEQNMLLSSFQESAKHIIEKALRKKIPENPPAIIKTAMLYIIWQLYFHRDDNELKMIEIEKTVALMLSDIREMGF